MELWAISVDSQLQLRGCLQSVVLPGSKVSKANDYQIGIKTTMNTPFHIKTWLSVASQTCSLLELKRGFLGGIQGTVNKGWTP